MKRLITAVVVVMAVMFSGIGYAEGLSAEAPKLTKGESWTMASGATETFLREENGSLVFWREDKKFSGERYRTKDLNLMYDIKDGVQVNTRRPHFGLLSFPMHIGSSWGHSYQNKGTWRTNRYEVVAFEKVTVKAGTFDAFRIEGMDTIDGKQYGIKVTVWYAPSVKNVVKMIGEDETNHTGIAGWNFELGSYHPAN